MGGLGGVEMIRTVTPLSRIDVPERLLAVEAMIGATAETIPCDSNKKYLSTALCKHEPAREEYRTPGICLGTWRAIGIPA